MERAVDGDDVALSQHLLKVIDTAATDFLLHLGRQGLIVIVEQLLAVEWLQTTQDTLSNTANTNGTDDLGFQVILILGHSSNVPVAIADLFVSRDEIAYEDEDGHHDVFGDGDDVAASHFSHGDAAIGLVCGIEVDMVGSNTGSDGELEVLGLGQTLCGEISRVEAWTVSRARGPKRKKYLRGGDDDLCVDKLTIKGRILAFFIGRSHQSMTLPLKPLPQSKFVFSGA